jgi:predicted transcriptional regulator
MAKLVEEGLFVADATQEFGYRITELGKARLRAMEEK